MTPEAALAKVAYVLGRWKDNATRRRILTYDLRGEITLPAPIERITGEAATFNLQGVTTGQAGITQLVGHIGSMMARTTDEDGPANIWAHRLFPYLMCGAAEANDVHMLEQLHSIVHNFDVSSFECT